MLSDKIHAVRVKRTRQTNSSIVLPDILLDDDNTGGPKEWEILAVGPGRRNREGTIIPCECSPGDRVICHSYNAGMTLLKDGTAIITHDMIIAVIPKNA